MEVSLEVVVAVIVGVASLLLLLFWLACTPSPRLKAAYAALYPPPTSALSSAPPATVAAPGAFSALFDGTSAAVRSGAIKLSGAAAALRLLF
eukprot:SAG11_NODE_3180_length_2628_cov_7.505733_1_plen_92_part_00